MCSCMSCLIFAVALGSNTHTRQNTKKPTPNPKKSERPIPAAVEPAAPIRGGSASSKQQHRVRQRAPPRARRAAGRSRPKQHILHRRWRRRRLQQQVALRAHRNKDLHAAHDERDRPFCTAVHVPSRTTRPMSHSMRGATTTARIAGCDIGRPRIGSPGSIRYSDDRAIFLCGNIHTKQRFCHSFCHYGFFVVVRSSH